MPSHTYPLAPFWKSLLQAGLADDGWQWDWSAMSVGDRIVRAQIVAKSDGVWAGAGLVATLPTLLEGGAPIQVRCSLKDGDALPKGKAFLEIQGHAREVLALERPFLNLASYVSGIATTTRALTQEVARACRAEKIKKTPRVTPTRKTLPHYRDLAVYGVLVGGGYPHRVGLASGVLIKENHIASAGGIEKAITAARALAPHGLKIEIEVTTTAELLDATRAGADIVMLDNFSPPQIKTAITTLQKTFGKSHEFRVPMIEVSGGITLGSIGQYCMEGVDVISVGSLTHSVRSVDLSLLVKSK